MGEMAAEVVPPAAGGNDALLTVIGAVVVAAIGGAVTVIVAALGRNKTTASPPAPVSVPGVGTDLSFRDYVVGELAVAKRRLDDHDETIDIQDRRLDQIEKAKDHDHPGWRSL